MKEQITNTAAKQEAINFLLSFTKSDFGDDLKTYRTMKVYKIRYKKGQLKQGSIETVLEYLGYEKTVTWSITKPSDKLIDILVDKAIDVSITFD